MTLTFVAWLTTYSSRTNDISLSDMGQVKKPEGGERANVRWADVNGTSTSSPSVLLLT